MNKNNDRKKTGVQGRNKTPGQKPGSNKPNARDTAQEAVHEVMTKKAAAPLKAARGDDDLMSKQQSQSMPSVDEVKGKWKQQMGSAKIAWGKLTEDELLKSEGHAQKLAGLVQERYAVTREEADKQIKSFFDKHDA